MVNLAVALLFFGAQRARLQPALPAETFVCRAVNETLRLLFGFAARGEAKRRPAAPLRCFKRIAGVPGGNLYRSLPACANAAPILHQLCAHQHITAALVTGRTITSGKLYQLIHQLSLHNQHLQTAILKLKF